jgi:hypothetical protein
MARPCHDISYITAKTRAADKNRFGWRNVILFRGKIIDRDRDATKIQTLATQNDLALRKFVIEITIPLIERMIGGGHPG